MDDGFCPACFRPRRTFIVRHPEMRDKLIGLGAEPAISTPPEFADLIKSELVKWARVVKESGAKLD